jgi:hypothetical protein
MMECLALQIHGTSHLEIGQVISHHQQSSSLLWLWLAGCPPPHLPPRHQPEISEMKRCNDTTMTNSRLNFT